MANSHDASERVQDLEYLYASIVNLSNFVSVKLSSDRNYHLWKTQMLCLMKSHNMAGIVDDAYESPSTSSKKIMDQYDSLLKGWIFGSASENVLGAVVDLASAKDVWDQLKSFYDVTVSHQQVYSALTKSEGEAEAEAETNTESKDVDVISAQTSTNGGDAVAIDVVSTEIETEGADPDTKAAANNKTETKKNLREATMKGDWKRADSILKEDNDLVREAISSDGSTILHIAVGIDLATELIEKFPKFASKNDDVLMAIAKTFPSGDYGETYDPPSWKLLWEGICTSAKFMSLPALRENLMDVWNEQSSLITVSNVMLIMVLALLLDVLLFLFGLILLPSYALSYLVIWMSILIVEPFTHIRKNKEEMDEAEKVLELVCDEIDKLEFTGTHHPYYTRPILEAACQNAHKVVDEILYRSPEAILSTDQSGYDIIQLAVIHRSERIYNLIYDIGERKNLYRTIVDSSKNNILHLAGRLAPSSKLNKRTGAALQLQRELQWREEVKKVVFPTYITQENIFKETPGMVFTREHEKLVKDGESWMKTTSESCSITAALITTIVFAAAITVPGGSNQETGIPVFTKDIPFIIFAVSDAISLFASSTALLVFLSILTARFSEEDFLVSLPRRLLIGICSLLLSAISMMVAFSSTLYLVFCHQKLWMLAPICGLSIIPISFFVALQLPLIVDLFQSTYQRKFGPRRRGKRARFNPDSIRLFFGK